MATKINWTEAEREYVQSKQPKTLSEIASMYNVSERSCHRHSTEGEWVRKRREFWSAAAEATRLLAVNRQAEANIDSLKIVETITSDLSAIADEIVVELATRDLTNIRSDELINMLPRVSNAVDKGVRAISFLKGGPDSRQERSFADLANKAR